MAETTSVNIRMNSRLKHKFEVFCKEIGLTMTAAFNVFAKKVVKEQRIPFTLGNETLSPQKPNSKTIRAINEARRGVGLSPKYTSVDELIEALDADD